MSTVAAPLTLSDLLPRVSWRSAALVVGASLLTAAAAQLKVNLPFTPVPVTGQTFAVLLSGATLGWRKGAASQVLYVVMGWFLPFYAEGKHGWKVFVGSTGGYLVGFVVAAAIIGWLAERRQDRRLLTSIPVMLVGEVIIFSLGVLWLAHVLKVPLYNSTGKNAFAYGVRPFLAGDAFKLVLAGVLTPAAWRFARKS